jgi:hypothetical protein
MDLGLNTTLARCVLVNYGLQKKSNYSVSVLRKPHHGRSSRQYHGSNSFGW